jgi:hypothetical protein
MKNAVSLIAAALVFANASAFAQTLSVDKTDYEPAETVNFTGAGFAAGETVSLTASGDTNGSQISASATAGEDGAISGSFVLPPVYEKNYALSASGTSGDSAQLSFRDSPGSLDRQAPNSAMDREAACGETITLTARVRTNGNVSVQGLAVTWTAEQGSVAPNTGISDTNGEITTVHTVAATAGMYDVAVAANDGSPKTFWHIKAQCEAPAPVAVAPTITCPTDMELNTEPGLCGAVANFSATATGTPAPSITYTQQPGTLFGTGSTNVTATATNEAGSTSCSFYVKVKDVSAPQITAPANAAYECAGNVPAATPADATATDNCSATVSVSETSNGGAGTIANPLVITRTYTATDPEGNTASADQTITVIDAVPPSISIAPAAGNACTIALGTPVLSDNCGGPVTATNNAPQWFPLGGSNVTWTATDDHGNSATANQSVIVTGYGPTNGFFSPVGASARPGQVKKGSSLPVKFALQCAYPYAQANISVDPAKATSTSYPKVSNAFRFSSTQYIFNLDMNNTYTVGNTYNIVATLNDGQVITGAITVSK